MWHREGFLLLMLIAAQCLGQRSPAQEVLLKPELILQTSHSGTVLGVAFSPDAKTLVSAGEDGMLKLWATSKRHELKSINLREVLSAGGGPDGQLRAVAFRPDGGAIAIAAGQVQYSLKPARCHRTTVSG